MRIVIRSLVAAVLAAAAAGSFADENNVMVFKENMQVLHCDMPDLHYRFLGSDAQGQLFLPGQSVNLRLGFTRGRDSGRVNDFKIVIQEIITRDPDATAKSAGLTDTAGYAPLLGLGGKPIVHPISVMFTDQPGVELEVKGLPLPERFGTYALVLERGGKRQFLGTVARVPKPREFGQVENVPIFGEGSFFNDDNKVDVRAATFARMGVRGFRSEIGWSANPDGTTDWSRTDRLFAAAEKAGLKIMVTVGGDAAWTRYFSDPAPAIGWTPATGGYSGTGDWVCEPKNYPRLGQWLTTFCQRYWKDGKGALWGLENYNEPWEGGGISGWARDCLQYREIQKTIAAAARSVSPDIRLLGASSIMNTEDKFYSDGSKEFDQYIDIFTDHYVPPPMCYGPMVAAAHGKQSMETETWFVNSEFLLPQGVTQFMASGQKRIAPWHPRVLYDTVPGASDSYFIPTPLVAATASLNYFLTGKTFEKMVFLTHLPWVFQFGKDDDHDALMVMFGQLMTIGGIGPRERLWAQVDGTPGGTITIDNTDGLLRFYDLAGNPVFVGEKMVKLPMSIYPSYIKCDKGPIAAAARLAKARIEGKKPVEILPRDFTSELTARDAGLAVSVHNCLNRAIKGTLDVASPDSIVLVKSRRDVELAAGETKVLTFGFTSARPNPGNAYPFTFHFASDAGNADYSEVLNVTVAKRRTMKLDGSLEEWKNVPGITVVSGPQSKDVAESARRPWLDLSDKEPDGSFAEIKLAWDDQFVYLLAVANTPKPKAFARRLEGRDENLYFHTNASDQKSPYKEFLKNHPGKTFADVPYIYCESPETDMPFRRDRFQVAFDTSDGWHDLKPDTDKVPYGFHNVPDTDYEYSVYLCNDGKPELWRQLAPGVPRMHDFPRQPRGKLTTGPVPGAKYFAKLDGHTYIYEMAIPRDEIKELKLAPGTTFGFTFRIGDGDGPAIEYGIDKAVTKVNGLTLHPYWERHPSCSVKWKLVE